jgi:hypothetical protein
MRREISFYGITCWDVQPRKVDDTGVSGDSKSGDFVSSLVSGIAVIRRLNFVV